MKVFAAYSNIAAVVDSPRGVELRPEVSQKCAEMIVGQMGIACDTVQSWTLAVIGGTIALLAGVVRLNLGKEKAELPLRFRWLVVIGILFQVASLLAGFLVRNMLVNSAPLFFGVKFFNQSPMLPQDLPESSGNVLQCMMQCQVFLLAGGVAAVALFALLNFYHFTSPAGKSVKPAA